MGPEAFPETERFYREIEKSQKKEIQRSLQKFRKNFVTVHLRAAHMLRRP